MLRCLCCSIIQVDKATQEKQSLIVKAQGEVSSARSRRARKAIFGDADQC